jgi:hypothetical protein
MSKKVRKGKRTISWKREKQRNERKKRQRAFKSALSKTKPTLTPMGHVRTVDIPEKRLAPTPQQLALASMVSPTRSLDSRVKSILMKSARTGSAGE